MMLVPAGCFEMGSEDGDGDESPVHEQCFDVPFWIDKTEVSQAQYRVNGGNLNQRSNFVGEDLPVEQITWFSANSFCLQRGARLPTEAEWEFSARGPDNLIFPWGNVFVTDIAVHSGNSGNQTANVGSLPSGASWIGALDLAGNVWEWTSSLNQQYPYDHEDGREADTGTNNSIARVLRGGSWYTGSYFLRSTDRNWLTPGNWYVDDGFRCARDFGETIITAEDSTSLQPASTPTLITVQVTPTATGDQPAVTVNVDSANLRSGPGTSHGVVGTAHAGEAFAVIGRTSDSEWLLVERNEGGRAWIWSGIVTISVSSDTITVVATVAPTQSVVNNTSSGSGGSLPTTFVSRPGAGSISWRAFQTSSSLITITITSTGSNPSVECFFYWSIMDVSGPEARYVIHNIGTGSGVFQAALPNTSTSFGINFYRTWADGRNDAPDNCIYTVRVST